MADDAPCDCNNVPCGADEQANALMTALRESSGVTFPEINWNDGSFQLPSTVDNPLYASVSKLTNTHLTEKKIDGLGTFDVLMSAFSLHLADQYDKGRITGAEYTKAYIELTTSAMSTAVNYLLGKDQAYWNAILAQKQAQMAEAQVITARVALKTAQFQLVQVQNEAFNAEAQFALTKMQLTIQSVNYCTAKYQLEAILPAELAGREATTANVVEDTAGKNYDRITLGPQRLAQLTQQTNLLIEQVEGQNIDNEVMAPKRADILDAQKLMAGYQADHQLYENANIQPKQALLLTSQNNLLVAQVANQTAETTTLLPEQVRNVGAQADTSEYQVNYVLPKQVDQITAQIAMVEEQLESVRAQTLDTRTDGAAVTGVLGKQKELQAQQIISYQRDSETKVAKFWTDAWITMKTIDDGLVPPDQWTNTNINTMLATLRENVDL